MNNATQNQPKLVAYLAHPYRAATLEERQNNIAGVLAWVRFLVTHTNWSVLVPWLPYVMTLEATTFSERGHADDLAALLRSDFVVLAGGRISVGMEKRRCIAIEHGIPVVDATSLGVLPPDRFADNARAVLMLRAKNAIDRGPRRVWLPPATKEMIGDLRALRLAARSFPNMEDAVDLLSTIIARAEVRP